MGLKVHRIWLTNIRKETNDHSSGQNSHQYIDTPVKSLQSGIREALCYFVSKAAKYLSTMKEAVNPPTSSVPEIFCQQHRAQVHHTGNSSNNSRTGWMCSGDFLSKNTERLQKKSTLRDPIKVQVCRQKYPAGSSCISDDLSISVPELEECFLTTCSLYLPALYRCIQSSYLHMELGLQSSVHEPRGTHAPKPVLQSTNSPLPLCCVCQWKKLANSIYKYFCLLALCLMLCY